jgi:hypothetical protein
MHRIALENRVREHSRSLEEVENRYSALVDLCPDSLQVHVGGSIVFANEVAARLGGNEPEIATQANTLGSDLKRLFQMPSTD